MINNKNEVAIKAFGKRLQELRLANRLSQERLAILAEIPISQVGRIERGEGNPTLSTLVVLASSLGISLNEMMTY